MKLFVKISEHVNITAMYFSRRHYKDTIVTDLVGGKSSVGLQGEGRSAGFGEEFHQVGVTSLYGVVQCRSTTLAFLKGTRSEVLS